jgi:uncharacterized membrane protein
MAEAKELLDHIKAVAGLTSKDIAKKLGYNESYFSRGVKEGSEEIAKRLRAVFPQHLSTYKARPAAVPDKMDKMEQAILKALLQSHLRLKAEVTGRKMEDLLEEFDQDTRLIFYSL